MNQLKNVLTSLFKPLTEPEVYTNLATKLAMVIIYILVGLIVIGIINKAIEEAFKFQNKSNRGNKNALKRSCPYQKCCKIHCVVYRTHNSIK